MSRFTPPLLLSFAFCLGACAGEPAIPDQSQFQGPGGKADGPYNHSLWVDSYWTEVGDTPGKQSIAIMKADAYSHSEHFVMFGEKNGNLRVRDFVGSYIVIDKAGHSEGAQDDFYKFNAEFVTDDEMHVTLDGLFGSKFELVYKRKPLTWARIADARAAAESFYAQFDELRDRDVATVDDLKAHIRLHMRTHDYQPNESFDAPDWQFEFQWLQIESYLDLSNRNSSLAGETIVADGSDAISQHFFARTGATEWTLEAEVPDPEDVLEDFDWHLNDEPPTFYVVLDEIAGVEPGPIFDGLSAFAGRTIAAMHPFECSDHYDFTTDYYWYLTDGSLVSYQVSPECD